MVRKAKVEIEAEQGEAVTSIHPLLLALQNVKSKELEVKALRLLARIQHGIDNREKWIANRKRQQDVLMHLQSDILKAYDENDLDTVNNAIQNVMAIVSQDEGVSAMEEQVLRSFSDAEDGRQRAAAAAFPSGPGPQRYNRSKKRHEEEDETPF